MAYDTSKPKGDMDLIGGGGSGSTSTGHYGTQFQADTSLLKNDLFVFGALVFGIAFLLWGVRAFVRLIREPDKKGKKKEAEAVKDTPPDADPMDFDADGQDYQLEVLDDPNLDAEAERMAREEIEAKYADSPIDEEQMNFEINSRKQEIFEELVQDYLERHPDELEQFPWLARPEEDEAEDEEEET